MNNRWNTIQYFRLHAGFSLASLFLLVVTTHAAIAGSPGFEPVGEKPGRIILEMRAPVDVEELNEGPLLTRPYHEWTTEGLKQETATGELPSGPLPGTSVLHSGTSNVREEAPVALAAPIAFEALYPAGNAPAQQGSAAAVAAPVAFESRHTAAHSTTSEASQRNWDSPEATRFSTRSGFREPIQRESVQTAPVQADVLAQPTATRSSEERPQVTVQQAAPAAPAARETTTAAPAAKTTVPTAGQAATVAPAAPAAPADATATAAGPAVQVPPGSTVTIYNTINNYGYPPAAAPGQGTQRHSVPDGTETVNHGTSGTVSPTTEDAAEWTTQSAPGGTGAETMPLEAASPAAGVETMPLAPAEAVSSATTVSGTQISRPAPLRARSLSQYAMDARTQPGIRVEAGTVLHTDSAGDFETESFNLTGIVSIGSRKAEAGAILPYRNFDADFDESQFGSGAVSGDGIGDLRLYGKMFPWSGPGGALGVGAVLTLPTGGEPSDLADNTFSFMPYVSGVKDWGPVSFSGRAGYGILTGADEPNNNEALHYGGGFGLGLTQNLAARVEAIGRTEFVSGSNIDRLVLETGFDMRVPLDGVDFYFRPVGGWGLTSDAPDWSLGASFGLNWGS